MMLASTLDAAVCYACMLALSVATVRSRDTVRRGLATPFGHVLATAAAMALAVRALAPPAIIHAGLHGYSLLDSIVAWPKVEVYKPGYGHASFVTLGLACRLLGFLDDGLRETAMANAAFGTGILLAASLLAFRSAGALAGYATMAAGILHPLFVRTAASEDAHVVACFYGMVALVAADEARRAKAFTYTRLLVLVGAGLLAFYGRQSMFFWPVLLGLVAGWGRFRELASRSSTWLVLGIVGLAAVPKMLILADGAEESYGLMLMLTIPLLTPSAMARHPLFRPMESGALLLALVGVIPILAKRRDPTLVALAGGAVFAFATSYAMSVQPGYGLEYGFRLPLFSLLLPLAGVGAARIVESVHGFVDGLPAIAMAIAPTALFVLCAYPAPALLRVLARPSPLAQEYRLVAAGTRALQGDVPVNIRSPVAASELKVPHSAFAPAVQVIEAPVDPAIRTGYAYQGLGCFCYPIKELVDPAGPTFNARAFKMSISDIRAFSKALWDDPAAAIHQLGGSPPTEMRPECTAAFHRARRFIPWGEVEVGRQEPLDRYLVQQRIPIGVWELGADEDQTRGAR
jgi:hypothetical protein